MTSHADPSAPGSDQARTTRADRAKQRRAAKDATQRQELAAIRESDAAAAEQHKALMGRPSEYTPEQADSLCAWVAEGRSTAAWCRQHGRAMVTVYRWLREHADFRERYAHAHDDRADTLADQLVDIADSVTEGTVDQVAAARLRIDTRKWVAAKLRPSKWGEAPPAPKASAVVFNIGIRPPLSHSAGRTLDGNALTINGDAAACESAALLPPVQQGAA